MKNKNYPIVTAAIIPFLVIVLLGAETAFGQCDAHFSFNGSLEDSSGNGVHGTMFGRDGAKALPRFAGGVEGQALQLDGTSAMRSYLDLHPDRCPQITIAGWVRVESQTKSNKYLISTEGGPGLRTGARNATLSGSGNGLTFRDVVRDPRAWFFFAGVFDYTSRTYRFHWRDRMITGELSETARPAADVFWVGAYSDVLNYASDAAYVDELRVIGRALTPDEVTRLRGNRQAALSRTGPQKARQSAVMDGSIRPVAIDPDRFRTIRPAISAEDLPDRRPLLPGAVLLDTGGEEDGQIELREAAGLEARGGPTPDANLVLPGNDPGSRLQEELDALPDTPPANFIDEISCDIEVVPVMETLINASLPERFRNALDQVAKCGFEPTVVAINSKDQWIISAGDQVARSTNLPADLAQTLDSYERTHGQLDAAHIASDGKWLVAAGNEHAESGLNLQARFRAGSITRNGGRIVSFSINPTNSDRWLMVDDSGTVYGEPRPWQVNSAAAQFGLSQIEIRQAQYMPDGSWILLGSDHWYMSDGLGDTQLRRLNQLRIQNKNVVHVLGHKTAGEFLVVSYGLLPMRSSDRIWQVENNMNSGNIWARLNAHNLTAASVVVVRNNQIAWSRAYGLRNSSEMESFVQPDTTFDVASISKPVAAFALMQLVDDPNIKLDITALGGLEQLEDLFPADERDDFRDQVQPETGNIALVMQHCAGFCYGFAENCDDKFKQGGAKSYSQSSRVPTTEQIIMGTSPADFGHRVKRDGQVGKKSRYTSGNYVFVQALIDLLANGFVPHTNKMFQDLGMSSSTFAAPYPLRTNEKFARGHNAAGSPQPLNEYGEMAAASLISTAPDIARFIIALNQDGGGLLTVDTFNRFVGETPPPTPNCDDPDSMALGIRRSASAASWGDNEAIWHGGLHGGYRTRMVALPGLDSGVFLVMTGKQSDADAFYSEFKASVKSAYNIR